MVNTTALALKGIQDIIEMYNAQKLIFSSF